MLVSGAGTNLQALLDACEDSAYGARVVAVGSDREGVEGLARADRAGIPTFVNKLDQYTSRQHWDHALADRVSAFEPDLVVLAGFMKLVGAEFMERLGDRTVNTPPGPVAVVPGHAGPGGRPRLRGEGQRRDALHGRRRRGHRPDRGPGRGDPSRTTTTSSPCTSG